MFSRSLSVASLVALLAVAGPTKGLAQSADAVPSRPGTLAGLVVDETEAVVPDVQIGAMNVETGVRRQTTSVGDGTFAMPLLPAGTYVVTAEHEGFAPLEVRNITLGRDQYLMLRIRLRIGRVQNTVDVTAEGSDSGDVSQILLPAAARAASGIRVSGDLQQQLPLSANPNFADALLLASGVISRAQTGTHLVHGADGSDTVVLVDGADLTPNRQSSTMALRIGPETIDHVDVRTAGMDASMPLTQGAVLKVATRSGGNDVRGEASALFNGRSWTGNNEPGGTSPHARSLRPGVSVGAPIKKDRAWLFGSYSRSDSRSATSRSSANIATMKALVPGWVPYDLRNFGEDRYVKAVSRVTPAHEISAFYQSDSQSSDGPGEPAATPFLRASLGGNAFAATWNSVWSDRVLTRFSATFSDKSETLSSNSSGTPLVIYRSVYDAGTALAGTAAIAAFNGAGCCADQPSSKLSFAGEATWFRARAVGSHEVQIGFLLQPRLRLAQVQRLHNGRFLEEAVLVDPANPASGYRAFHRQIYDTTELLKEDSHGTDNAIFVQDGWRPSNRLTIAAGVRIDRITDFDVISNQQVRNALAVGPRSSVTFEVTPTSTLRASWGRVHESSPAGRYVADSFGGAGRHDLYDKDLDGVYETDIAVPRVPLSAIPLGVDVERRQAYVNEVTAGYRVRLPGRIALDTAFVRRGFHALPLSDTGFVYQDGLVVGFRPGNGQVGRRVTADLWTVPVVSDFTVQATKLSGRLQMVASYTRTFRHLTGTWVPSDPASVLQPAAFANDKGIGSTRAATTDALSSAGLGELSIDHSLRSTFVCQLPRSFSAAVNYQFQSGPWSGPIVTNIPAPDPKYGPVQITLNGVRTTNPLATTLRFAYATRGDGQIQLPAVHLLNVRFGRRLQTRFGRLDLALDVFNPFNWGRFLEFQSSANRTFSPAFGQGSFRQNPRMLQASVRFFF